MEQQNELKGKRILLMAFRFYDYADRIKEELERQGAHVCVVFNPWPKESFSYSTNWLLTLAYRLKNPFFRTAFTKEVLKEIGNRRFDILFAVGGFCAKKKLLEILKKRNPQLTTRIFFWDSFCYWKISKQRKWFDKSFSFDPVDCRKYPDLIYQPDFYIGSHTASPGYTYDISHIGASHIFAYHRMPVLWKFKKELEEKQLKSYLTVVETRKPADLKFKLLALTSCKWRKYRNTVKHYEKMQPLVTRRRIPYGDVVDIESRSRCIVDIPPARQAGITIRALEAIAAGKKLITTNRHIKEQAFYTPENIAILDTEHPQVDAGFIYSESKNTNIEYLRLDNWLKTVLC